MKIVVAGDFCPNSRIENYYKNGNFKGNFSKLRDVLIRADVAIVNLECPIVQRLVPPINKCGPNLKAPPKSVELIKFWGFNIVTLANNHFFDYGLPGVIDTLDTLNKNQIKHVGGGKNLSEASSILYSKISNRTLAVINCCENEFSIATKDSGGSNPLNPIQQYYSIKEAKKEADFVLVIVHGGHEQYQLPSPRMKETYRFFIEAGADAVVNHHQHCYSGYEVYNGKPIFYGLGNFLFDKKGENHNIWNEGYLVNIEFSDLDNPHFSLEPYNQCNEYPIVTSMDEIWERQFFNRITELNEIIDDDEKLNKNFQLYVKSNERMYLSIFQPYKERYLNSLYIRGFLPSFITNKLKYRIKDYIECESHLDKLRQIIESKMIR